MSDRRERKVAKTGGAAVASTGIVVDLRVAQLMCSRLCHDLVGPVGAINAGLELVLEGMPEADRPLDLVVRTAIQANRRLAFYRAAFGGGGGDTMGVARVRDLAGGLLAEGNVRLDWPLALALVEEQDRPLPMVGARLLLNVMLLAAEALPRGGVLGVNVADLPEGVGVAVVASGTGAKLHPNVLAALDGSLSVEELSARVIPARLAGYLAEAIGAVVEVAGETDEVHFAVLLPLKRG